MKELNTKHGVLFVDELEEEKRDEWDRVKVYDSDKRYLEYFIFDDNVFEGASAESYYENEIINALLEAEHITDILDMLDYGGGDGYVYSTHIQVIHDELYPEKADEPYFETDDVTSNDNYNRIGEWHILMKD